jgi:nucleoside kinase
MEGRHMKPFLTVYGHVSLDQIMTVDQFPKMNTSVDVLSKETSLGGTAANVAVTAARLGVPTAICSFVGRDMPEKYEELMRSSGLILDEMVKVDGYDTSTALVINDSNLDQKVLFFQGPHGYASKLGIDLLKNAKESKFVHFCTGEPDYHIRMMRELRSKERITAFDPAQEIHRLWNSKNLNDALSVSDMLFCNRFEAESVLKYLGAESFAHVKHPFILCTKGSEGCDLYIDGNCTHFPIVKAEKVVDATGAGDSFRAGFYAGQYRGMSIEESVIIAATVSSFIVEKTGTLTNTPTWDAVMERADPYLSEL